MDLLVNTRWIWDLKSISDAFTLAKCTNVEKCSKCKCQNVRLAEAKAYNNKQHILAAHTVCLAKRIFFEKLYVWLKRNHRYASHLRHP